MSALNAVFQASPKAFKPVHMRTALHVLAVAVANDLVSVAFRLKKFVGRKLIGMNRGALLDVLLNNRIQAGLGTVGNDLGDDLATTFEHSENNCLPLRPTASTCVAGLATANVGFVDLNLAKEGKLPIYLGNVLTNLMAHAPRTLVRHAKLAFQFLGRNAMAGSSEKIDGIEPKLQGGAAILKGSANRGVKMMSAPLAGIGAFRLNFVPVRLALALRAGMALAEANGKNVLQTVLICGELLEKITDGDAGLFLLPLDGLRLHGTNL